MRNNLLKWLGATGLALSCACVVPDSSQPVNPGYYPRAQVTVSTPQPYTVQTMPPDPLFEQMTPSPGYGFVWIDGSWHWNGYEWVWVSGRWEQEQVGSIYVQPYYDYVGGEYIYTPGYWSTRDRIPHGSIVRDHRDGRPAYIAPPPRGTRPPPGGPRPTPIGPGYRPLPGQPAQPTRPIGPRRPVVREPQGQLRPADDYNQPVGSPPAPGPYQPREPQPVRPAQPYGPPPTPDRQPTPVRPYRPTPVSPARPVGPPVYRPQPTQPAQPAQPVRPVQPTRTAPPPPPPPAQPAAPATPNTPRRTR